MARQQKKKKAEIGLTKAKEDTIWGLIPKEDWLNLYRTYHPNNRSEISGNSILAQCIYHAGDSNPSLRITPDKRLAKCFGGGCNHAESSPIKLYASIKNVDIYEAISEISTRYGVKILSKKDFKDLERQEAAFKTHSLFNDLTHNYLLAAYNFYSTHPELLEKEEETETTPEEAPKEKGIPYSSNLLKILSNTPKDPPNTPSDKEINVDDVMGNVLSNNISSTTLPEFPGEANPYETIEPKDEEQIDKILDCPDSMEESVFKPAKKAVYYLKNIRKADEFITIGGIGVIPPEHIIKSFCEASFEEIESLIRFMRPIRDLKFIGQLVFPYHLSINRISHFKVRSITEEDTSRKNKTIIVLRDTALEEFSDDPVYYGLPYFKKELGATNKVTLVEGEFDFISCILAQMKTDSNREFFLALGGASSGYDLSTIKNNLGVTHINLLFDDPLSKGDELAYSVIGNSDSCLNFSIFKWDWPYLGKDPDEIFTQIENEEELVKAYNYITSNENYYTQDRFILKKIKEFVDSENNGHSGTSYKVKLIIQKLNEIKNSIVSRSLINPLAALLDIDPNIIRDNMRSVAMDQHVFYERWKTIFEKEFEPMGIIKNDSSTHSELAIWNNTHRYEGRISCARLAESQTLISEHTGSFYSWVEDKIGIPFFIKYLPDTEPPQERYRYDIEAMLRKNFSSIITDCMKGLPQIRDEEKYRGGNFYMSPKLKPHDPKKWYIHNGEFLFVGEYNDQGKITFRREEKPIVDGHYFEVTSKSGAEDGGFLSWSEFAVSEKNMNSTDLFDLREIFERNLQIMQECFQFQRGVDAYLLALFYMYIPIYACFTRRIFLNINGETSSGKSRIGEGLLGGKVNKESQIVEPVVNISHYTEAGVRQSSHKRNLLACLDEFEDSGGGDAKSLVVRNVLETFRTAECKTHIVKGSPSGVARSFTMDMPILSMSVRPFTEAMDVNRFLTASTKKITGHADPNTLILERFSVEELEKLKYSHTAGLFRHVPKIKEYEKELNKHLNKNKKEFMSIPQRTISQLVPLATIYSAAYDDITKGIEFIKMYEMDNYDSLRTITNVGMTPLLWNTFLRSERFKISYTSNDREIVSDYTLMRILQTEDLRNQLINRTVHGVKLFIKEDTARRYYLIISWTEAADIFKHKSEFKNYPHQKLKTVADRDARVMPPAEVKTMIQNNNEAFMENDNLEEITVIDVTDIVRKSFQGAGSKEMNSMVKDLELQQDIIDEPGEA